MSPIFCVNNAAFLEKYEPKYVAFPPSMCQDARSSIPEESLDDLSLEALKCLAKAVSHTVYHQVGTAKMGVLEDDPMAVTDPRLRVRGVTGLRVIDASVMPHLTSGNTNAPAIMIGERGAELILEDRG